MNKSGGANTNKSGKAFEKETDGTQQLLQSGYEKIVKSASYLHKKINNKDILFFQQTNFRKYMLNEYNIIIKRNPDEIYMIKEDNHITFKIIEKKNQQCSGTVDSKIYNGPYFIEEYTYFLKDLINKNITYKVEYAYSLSDYFKNLFETSKKWQFTKDYLKKHNINIFFPSQKTYFSDIDNWITNKNVDDITNKIKQITI